MEDDGWNPNIINGCGDVELTGHGKMRVECLGNERELSYQ